MHVNGVSHELPALGVRHIRVQRLVRIRSGELCQPQRRPTFGQEKAPKAVGVGAQRLRPRAHGGHASPTTKAARPKQRRQRRLFFHGN